MRRLESGQEPRFLPERQSSAVLGHIGYTEYGRHSAPRGYGVEGLECRMEEVGVEASCTINSNGRDGILFVDRLKPYCEGYMHVKARSGRHRKSWLHKRGKQFTRHDQG